jgi:hypothetical protein
MAGSKDPAVLFWVVRLTGESTTSSICSIRRLEARE